LKYGWVIFAFTAQCLMVCGQILLKKSMMPGRRKPMPGMALAIGCMTLYFFLWLALARQTPLSQLAPFDALGPVLLVAAAQVIMREKLSGRAWAGIGLILAGISVIALS
jgi:drug/metabolite transporter (DMT)-like permease